MKRILIMLGAVLAALLMLAGPATAGGACYCSPWDYFKQVDCPGLPNTSGHLAINKDSSDHLYVEGDINDGANHGWDWKLWHNGDISWSGSEVGSFTKDRMMVNFVGAPEDVTFVATANTGEKCKAEIIVYGQ